MGIHTPAAAVLAARELGRTGFAAADFILA